ncbi:hypothetical protein PAXRUDRAFT_823130 [Paxillus rubicundulus Ve08.2h10]|uniref:Uncharacterized protein n=1 Tax=Paxillus rubicundulus Ve08.2h10 TaxID=930991 RepID=A0A0D0ECB8_9AGAM|nr:hypothetical protein PAXRUDRAFT_823130 [Paxillus rubicundulus Ve08.2h10]
MVLQLIGRGTNDGEESNQVQASELDVYIFLTVDVLESSLVHGTEGIFVWLSDGGKEGPFCLIEKVERPNLSSTGPQKAK